MCVIVARLILNIKLAVKSVLIQFFNLISDTLDHEEPRGAAIICPFKEDHSRTGL